jgi:hypothetical protein
MARYTNIFSLPDCEWIKFLHDHRYYRIIMIITHRQIKIEDYLNWDDQYDFKKVDDFIVKRLKEINYYLDAIWC